jgi:hypothetical protein
MIAMENIYYRAGVSVCVHCKSNAHHNWYKVCTLHDYNNSKVRFEDAQKLEISHLVRDSEAYFCTIKGLHAAVCDSCRKVTLWIGNNIIYPKTGQAVAPHKDMPKEVREIYKEASLIVNDSPRASAALLRLALQILCKALGESGKNIDADIASLVRKGLPSEIQQWMDTLRVIGNEAVHPGTYDKVDNIQTAKKLFTILNLIVTHMITNKNELDELYNGLPAEKLAGIKNRK